MARLYRKREELRDLTEQETRKAFNLVKKDRYINGNKPGKLLARALKKKKNNNYVEKIRTKSGEIRHRTGDIANTFQEFYGGLYAINIKKAQDTKGSKSERTKKFLKEARLPRITESDKSMLEEPISELEIKKAIQEIPNGKSPGPDGLTALYYKKFQDLLTPRMCTYMNGIGEKWEMRKEALEASITVIWKEGKDNTLCSSYRPISLLNVDTKLFSKILADRLKRIINGIIHPDQVGFVPGREGRDNAIKTLLVVQRIQDSGAPGLLLSIDAEKAFDRVDWGFIWDTLEEIGLGDRLLRWIKALYSYPSARVKINGTLTEPFRMYNGTRQGCPLSPLLFVIALEPLLAKIRTSPDIRGVKMGEEEYKLAAFADDVLFYITHPTISLPNLVATLKEYGRLSNFRVNQAKSETLDIIKGSTIDTAYQSSFPFKWGAKELNYLGRVVLGGSRGKE